MNLFDAKRFSVRGEHLYYEGTDGEFAYVQEKISELDFSDDE